MTTPFVDIHCHLLPGIDDGAKDWSESVAMARLAAEDGATTVVATPHQLGSFSQVQGDDVRQRTAELNERLLSEHIPLTVLPGAEIRIEPELLDRLAGGELLSLGDHQRHVLLELPHQLYLPIESLLSELAARRVTVVLAHPERNEGILRRPELLGHLVDAGCLMQITAGSLCGTLGSHVCEMSEWMLAEGLVHVVATDAHNPRSRRPLLGRAYERLCALADAQTAHDLCCRHPARIAAGRAVTPGRRSTPHRRRNRWWSWRATG